MAEQKKIERDWVPKNQVRYPNTGLFRWSPLLMALVFVAACDSGGPADLTPPRVLRIDPAGPIIPVDLAIEVTFSEAMSENSIQPENLVLVLRTEVDDSFLADIGASGLNDMTNDALVPLDFSFNEDNTILTLTPERSLTAATAYSLVISEEVRDESGNPISDSSGLKTNIVYDLTTDDGPPMVVSHNAAGTVPANQKRFWVQWNQPVQGVTSDNMIVEPVSENALQPETEAVFLNPERTQATIILANADSCARMTPDATYALSIGPGLSDSEGDIAPMESLEFTVGGGCDVQQHVVLGSPQTIALEDSAVIRFSTNKPSTTSLFFGLTGGALDCLGAPCPVTGEDARALIDLSYSHEVAIEGLTLNLSYQYTVLAEDDVGFVATASGTFLTSEVSPVAVNELFPAPEGDDDLGEFIELVNYSDSETVDLTGFSLWIDGDEAYVFGETGGAPEIVPGGFIVVGQDEFDAGLFPGLDANVVLRGLGKALQNSSPQSIELRDSGDRPISLYPGYSALSPKEGRSIERTRPDTPDEESSFCFSIAGPSPGQPNSVVAEGC
jgi:hypothetical protein